MCCLCLFRKRKKVEEPLSDDEDHGDFDPQQLREHEEFTKVRPRGDTHADATQQITLNGRELTNFQPLSVNIRTHVKRTHSWPASGGEMC